MTKVSYEDRNEVSVDDEFVQDEIENLILDYQSGDDDYAISDVATFRQAGVLTNNKGLVIRTKCGKEFQVTIIRSR